MGEKTKKFIQGREIENKKSCKEDINKKIPEELIALSGLQAIPAQGAPWHAATLDCSFNFLVLVESPFTWCFLQLGKQTFFPCKVNILCAATSSWTLVAKHPFR